jgi:hypothetical protein
LGSHGSGAGRCDADRALLEQGGYSRFSSDLKDTSAPISKCSGGAGCQEKTVVTDPSNNDTVYTFTLDNGTLLDASSWNTGIDTLVQDSIFCELSG